MAVQILGNGGTVAEVDTNRNLLIAPGLPAHPAAGGFYSVSGSTSAVVAAALGQDTMLMSMRLAAVSTRKAYIYRARIHIAAATLGASAGVAGTLGLRRFTAQTPTGGTARTVNEMNEPLTGATDVTDVRDSNAALTGTAPTWGNVVSQSIVPLFISAGTMWMEWIVEPPYPIVLTPGDGLAIRTIVAMAATQTWIYSYTFYWTEQ